MGSLKNFNIKCDYQHKAEMDFLPSDPVQVPVLPGLSHLAEFILTHVMVSDSVVLQLISKDTRRLKSLGPS